MVTVWFSSNFINGERPHAPLRCCGAILNKLRMDKCPIILMNNDINDILKESCKEVGQKFLK